jgi:hypothetical protein
MTDDGRSVVQNARVDALVRFLRPLYLDLDGVSRGGDAERIARIARALHPRQSTALELLLAFHLLRGWLDKVGNLSRTVLNTGISEADLRQTAASIRRLDAPLTEEERTVAAAILIDSAGVRGLADKFARSRREGHSVADVAREALSETDVPEWMREEAREMLVHRRAQRDLFARAVLDE